MFSLRLLTFRISAIASFIFHVGELSATEFNTDLLDTEDKKNIDVSRFSRAGYIMPGEYLMRILVNGQRISPAEIPIVFKEDKHVSSGEASSRACLTVDVVAMLGFTPESLAKVAYRGIEKCADFNALPGIEIHPNQAESVLNLSIPVAMLEYSDASWVPPSRWENGIPGILLDYNINGSVNNPHQGEASQSLSVNGTVGANLGAWRLRADYQGSMNHSEDEKQGSTNDFNWSRVYLYRALPQIKSKLTLGENYINSDVFDSWRYVGASLESDERMLPPKLRGFAPQVSGIAETNARVIVSQQGRILYDSTVPAGPFTIQDLDSSVRGRLDVEVIEQNGQKKKFQVDAGYVPYLTRPGQVRYKLSSGRPLSLEGNSAEGPTFISGEVSWGAGNRWSPYGGVTIAGDYNALALGIAYDLGALGVISTDLTKSKAKFSPGDIPDTDAESLEGKSWRLAYFKRFEESNADISFAGYRFSDEGYLTMQQYLDARFRDDFSGREKELFTVSLNKRFEDAQVSVGLQYNYQTYWDEDSQKYYTASIDYFFDAFGFRDISVGLSASRSNTEDGSTDESVFLRLSVPWGNGTVSYNGNSNNGRYTHTAGYNGTLNDGLDSYSISAGVEHGDERATQGLVNAYYSHRSDVATLSANISSVGNSYTSYGVSASGGATITTKGAALHAGGMSGGTRMLIDTGGVGGVPVDGGRTMTNRWGIGVVTDLSSYYRNTTSVDMNKLPDDMDAKQSISESALTEGAIGYRKFEILKGLRLFTILRLADNSPPPFGASVTNAGGKELGIVGDGGLAWLTGISPGEMLNVAWNGKVQCVIGIPEKVNPEQQLLMPCRIEKQSMH